MAANYIRSVARSIPARTYCDRCAADAHVRVRVTTHNGPLYFCGHHYAREEGALFESTLSIEDERHLAFWLTTPAGPKAAV